MYHHLPKISCLSVLASLTQFPVRRVFCIGLNYADHVKEFQREKTDPVRIRPTQTSWLTG